MKIQVLTVIETQDNTVSEIIKKIMKAKGIKQHEMANKLGITQAGFAKALKINDFKISMLKKIAKVLDIELCDFLK